ncbi:hypothetical protein GH714_039920 [Hevea brasiliensis]|uniref:Uncharacterized protein n=1 Tax=Hevea brasiliensis TaxID=3981 RepID=A0A6A6M639_HEVBR|nr:hypothetical protein GH714_039920 [Hevea brasiliensis]
MCALLDSIIARPLQKNNLRAVCFKHSLARQPAAMLAFLPSLKNTTFSKGERKTTANLASRKQAEERVERPVVRIQAMFRPKKAQEEYRRIKLTHNQAGCLKDDTWGKAKLVSYPTLENPGGCTAADLASAKGYDGLAADLSEMFLVARFEDMRIAENVSGLLQTSATDTVAFRGFQVRRRYRKIVWSVGMLEKAILRWTLKRKGFRGLHVDPVEVVADERQESDAEEDFYQASRKQA